MAALGPEPEVWPLLGCMEMVWASEIGVFGLEKGRWEEVKGTGALFSNI